MCFSTGGSLTSTTLFPLRAPEPGLIAPLAPQRNAASDNVAHVFQFRRHGGHFAMCPKVREPFQHGLGPPTLRRGAQYGGPTALPRPPCSVARGRQFAPRPGSHQQMEEHPSFVGPPPTDFHVEERQRGGHASLGPPALVHALFRTLDCG